MGCQRETLGDTPACCRSTRETALPSVGASSGLPPGAETARAAVGHRGRARLPTASQERAIRSPECHCPAKEAHGAVASVSHVLNSHSKGEAHVQNGGGGVGGLSSGPLPPSTCRTGSVEGPRWAQMGRAGLARSLDTRRGWIRASSLRRSHPCLAFPQGGFAPGAQAFLAGLLAPASWTWFSKAVIHQPLGTTWDDC